MYRPRSPDGCDGDAEAEADEGASVKLQKNCCWQTQQQNLCLLLHRKLQAGLAHKPTKAAWPSSSEDEFALRGDAGAASARWRWWCSFTRRAVA